MYWTKILVTKIGEMEKSPFGRSSGHESAQTGRGINMVQKVFGIREAKNGTEIDELLQTGTDGHQRV